MGTHKPKRGTPAIDMTAMVDVAFLLLTFFILTTQKFREDSSVSVDIPSSVSQTELPPEKVMTISVDAEGAIFLGFSDIPVRERVLLRAASEKQWSISEEGLQYFSTLENFGVPFEEIEEWLNAEVKEEFVQKGVSAEITDTLTKSGNELKDWVRWGRLSDTGMRMAIKADANADYAEVGKVINTLQDWKINRFSLITNLEEPPPGMYVEAKDKVGWKSTGKKKDGEE